MSNPARLLAERLLKSSCIKLQPSLPFVLSSGWNSPIYSDHRRALSYPELRNFIKAEMARHILEEFPAADALAGVAPGAIAIGSIVADTLSLPYVYVRETPKDHGLENRIEGNLRMGQKVVVVEDLVSTGANSLKAAEAIREAGGDPVGMVTIFNYEFPAAARRFREAGIRLIALSDYSTMLDTALALGYIGPDDLETLREWREDPAGWTPRRPAPL